MTRLPFYSKVKTFIANDVIFKHVAKAICRETVLGVGLSDRWMDGWMDGERETTMTVLDDVNQERQTN